MSNELIAPVIPFISESPAAAHHVHHHTTAKETKPAAEIPYAPKVFKGAGHEKIERELAKALNKLPYMPEVRSSSPFKWKKVSSFGLGALGSLFSTQVTVEGAAITAVTTAVKYARNADGIKATQAAATIAEEAHNGGTFFHTVDNNKPPEPMALMGRTRLLRSRQGSERRIKSEMTFPIDAPPENQQAADTGSHVLKVTANSSTNGSGQSRG